ncbi:putative protein [Arabidopsis thaliana]|uniref:F-box family protein n=1 Tax=Arabidopsis thaliana TaxID=3702 RepID=Q9SN66_ARATH|nr:F-box family protein [Arabidopsis thaliana]AEE82932.1 F-box family protein [Arabidopsis thaliana]CAB40050.1 putative protein [Arabidopsis thaliana]CAB81183.1 putative protein [Arabidopsis thaliana]|eukprot:NP_192820.1 F-box family protein [Arabidopsis thaliana]
MLFPEDGCVLYNPEEDNRVYNTKRDFSKTRFLANSGNLFLTVDVESNLYIIDLFSEKRINLPPLDSVEGLFTLKRIGDKDFEEKFTRPSFGYRNQNVVNLRGLLWVDEENKEEYTVVWFFDTESYEAYNEFVANTDLLPPRYLASHSSSDDKMYSSHRNIVVTTSGEVLLVESIVCESRIGFRLYKKVPNPNPDELLYTPYVSVEVYSLGDEAFRLDLGIIVPADHPLGIEPSISPVTTVSITVKRIFHVGSDTSVCSILKQRKSHASQVSRT